MTSLLRLMRKPSLTSFSSFTSIDTKCYHVTAGFSSFMKKFQDRRNQDSGHHHAALCRGKSTSHDENSSSALAQNLCNHHLDKRGLLRCKGNDVLPFLQGLITNDTRLLEEPGSSMYAFILNVQGRVLYDLLLYNITQKTEDTNHLLVECDKEVLPDLMKLMKMYKIRKKVDLSVCEDFQSHAVFSSSVEEHIGYNICVENECPGVLTSDPRVHQLGWRLILPAEDKVSSYLGQEVNIVSREAYEQHRYRLGVAEGTQELPVGNCFPLESNGSFLNGVSFNKGCYIGQELTSRSHHIGVTRKRIMPIVFNSASPSCSPEDKVENATGKNSGRVRGVAGKFGIALLRLPDVTGKKGPLKTLNDTGEITGEIETHMPEWWQGETDSIIQQIVSKQKS